MIDSSIFKAYDIRGIYPEQLNEELIYKIGRAYADLRRQDNPEKTEWTIVVGRDMRLSSPQLHEALINGLRDSGMHVVDVGLASTPTFYFAVANYGYDGGMLVSASHNPGEYNGVKMVREKALPISEQTGIHWMRDRIVANELSEKREPGTLTNKDGVLRAHVESELALADVSAQIKPLTVVADAANSMGAMYLSEMFKHLPCELIAMNFDLDGNFPAHEADPFKEENVADLQKKVIEFNADLGIATDGDGDRIFFIDNTGKTIEPALIRGLMAMIELRKHPGATICYDIRPGRITRDLIEEHGGKPEVTRVGHSLIKEHALQVGSVFAGESSGHFFVNMPYGMYEAPVYIAAKLLAEFSQSGQTVAKFIEPYLRYSHSGEINFVVADKEAVLKTLEEKYGHGTINKIDGLSIEFDDWWFNVRASNTEPKLRLNLEAKSAETMKKYRDEISQLIESMS